MKRLLIIGFAVSGLMCQAAIASIDESFFESKIRPILVEHCYECHSSSSKKVKGGLRLDDAQSFAEGGDTGPVFLAESPEKSPLLKALRYEDPELAMPPNGKLPEALLREMEKWILAGAPFPPSQSAGASEVVSETKQSHWAFQPMKRPDLPRVKQTSWPQSPIDHFILAELEKRRLKPSAPASRATLLRRAAFDLLGLPPSPAEMDAFLTDQSPEAWPRAVERLLASPRYGERWGRYWLDLARYAESNGADENHAMPHAFRYRDYVIRSFNSDKPFSRFVEEQLAGDLLPSGSEEERYENWIATGFLVLGPKLLAEQDKVKMIMDMVDEQLDVTSRVFMGLTAGCARCHDHKFDPLPTRDYYAMAGIFKSTKTMKNLDFVSQWNERPMAKPEVVKAFQEHPKKVEAVQKRLEAAVQKGRENLKEKWKQQLAEYLLAGAQPEDETFKQGLNRDLIKRTEDLLEETKNTSEPWFRLWHFHAERLKAKEPPGESPSQASVEIPMALENLALQEKPPRSFQELAAFHHQAFTKILSDGKKLGTPFQLGPGLTGNALVCDGTTRLDRPHTPELEPSQFTISSWIHLSEVPSGKDNRRWIFSKNANEWEEGHFAIILNGLLPGGYLNIGGGRENVHLAVGETPLRTNHWEHVALSYDGSILQLYVNGAPTGSARVGKPRTPGSGPLTLGARPDGYIYFKGSLDEVLLFNRPLRPEEVEQLFKSRGRPSEDSVAQWTFDHLSAEEQHLVDVHRLDQILFSTNGLFALPENARDLFAPEDLSEISGIEEELDDMKKSAPPAPAMAMAVQEGTPENLKIHIRGNHLHLGSEVPRGFPSAIQLGTEIPIPANQSGRLELARWLTHPEHPLTWRVLANRLWLGHFGEGLVRTPDNFGVNGEPPSHPELLDWLATEIVRRNGSLKEMHKLILLSSTYQMSSHVKWKESRKDPENRWYWRMNRRRLEGEAIRDSLLQVAGHLSTRMERNEAEKNRLRTVYLPIMRNKDNDLLTLFDYSDPSVSTGRRNASVVPQQALFFMNSPLVTESAAALARLLTTLPADQQVQEAYLRVYGRTPDSRELKQAQAFLNQAGGLLPSEDRSKALEIFCHALLASNEFLYVN